jgi:ABC-type phosphate transport system substrate-binding protein
MRSGILFFVLFILAPRAARAEERGSGKSGFLVVINAENSVNSLERQALADIYLKRVTRWPNDTIIRPVDLAPELAARRQFSEVVLSRSVSGVKSYWQQLLFSGRDVPPPELMNDEQVIQYVLKNPGAIGYVSRASSGGGIKTIDIKW